MFKKFQALVQGGKRGYEMLVPRIKTKLKDRLETKQEINKSIDEKGEGVDKNKLSKIKKDAGKKVSEIYDKYSKDRKTFKKGTPNPFARKSKLKKIQEAFKTTPSFMNVKKDKPKKRLMAKKGSPDPKKKKKFPDLTGDGKVTFADILKGRGVIKGKKKTKKKFV